MKNLLPVIIHYLYSGCISLYIQTPLYRQDIFLCRTSTSFVLRSERLWRVTTTHISAWQEQRTTKTRRGRPAFGRSQNSQFLQTKGKRAFSLLKSAHFSQEQGVTAVNQHSDRNASNFKRKPKQNNLGTCKFNLFYMLLRKVMANYKSSSELLLESETGAEKKREESLLRSPCSARAGTDNQPVSCPLTRQWLTGFPFMQKTSAPRVRCSDGRERGSASPTWRGSWHHIGGANRLPTFRAIESQDARAPLRGLGTFSRGFSGL